MLFMHVCNYKSKGGKPIWNKELPATKRIHLLSAVLIMTLSQKMRGMSVLFSLYPYKLLCSKDKRSYKNYLEN